MKILILCGKYGMGHFSAANAIKEQLALDFKTEQAHIKVIDFIAYSFPILHKIFYKTFTILTKNYPKLFSRLYLISANHKKNNFFYNLKMVKNLKNLIFSEKPDLIISTLPEISRAYESYKKKEVSTIPLVTCVTDITRFYEWVNFATDIYLVPSLSVKEFLIKHQVAEDKIIISGIPVKQDFYHFKKNQSDKIRLLIMGGGVGNIPLADSFFEKIASHQQIETSVLCANNKYLLKKLQNKYPNIKSYPLLNNVSNFIQNADIIITKTGGITTFECIFAQVPIVTYVPFLPQEQLNAKFLEDNQMAKIMYDNPTDPYDLILEIIRKNELPNMQKNMAQMALTFDLNYNKKIKALIERNHYAQ